MPPVLQMVYNYYIICLQTTIAELSIQKDNYLRNWKLKILTAYNNCYEMLMHIHSALARLQNIMSGLYCN